MLDEIARTDLMGERPQDILIQPEIAVIDAFTVDPGLIRINIDYGYMRAYDNTLELAGKRLPELNRLRASIAALEITLLRLDIWEQERSVVTPMPLNLVSPGGGTRTITVDVFNKVMLRRIREMKTDLFDWTVVRYEACQNDSDSIPIHIQGQNNVVTDIEDWWCKWERHSNAALESQLSNQNLWLPAVVDLRQNSPNRVTGEVLEASLTLIEPGPVPWLST